MAVYHCVRFILHEGLNIPMFISMIYLNIGWSVHTDFSKLAKRLILKLFDRLPGMAALSGRVGILVFSPVMI